MENQRTCSYLDVLKSPPYNSYMTQGVHLDIVSATNTEYLLKAYHSSGNLTYTLAGPGGSIVPE